MLGGMYLSTTSALLASCEMARVTSAPSCKIDLLHPDALVADGLDARDVVHQRCQLALMQGQDAVLHVLRAHAVVGPDDRDDRDIDFREDVDGHAQCRTDSHEGDENKDGHDGVGPLERCFDDGHSVTLCLDTHKARRKRSAQSGAESHESMVTKVTFYIGAGAVFCERIASSVRVLACSFSMIRLT